MNFSTVTCELLASHLCASTWKLTTISVTKQPPQARLKDGIDHMTARREELEFFSTYEPWKTELFNAKDRFGKPLWNRFGTLALQTYLSQTLTELIRIRYAYFTYGTTG